MRTFAYPKIQLSEKKNGCQNQNANEISEAPKKQRNMRDSTVYFLKRQDFYKRLKKIKKLEDLS